VVATQNRKFKVIQAQPGRQSQFLSSTADITVYGGGAGGGKSFGLEIEALRNIGNGDYGAVIFRQSYADIVKEGGLWDEAKGIYCSLTNPPAVNEANHTFTFASGAKIGFGFLRSDADCMSWKSSQIALIGFDQLEEFSEYQFFYMLSRNRSVCGVKPYVRATANPKPGWLAKFIAWWLDEEGRFPDPEKAGKLRYFVRVDDVLHWADRPDDLKHLVVITEEMAENGITIDDVVKSVTFIPANVYDNPTLLKSNPAYLANLMAQPLVERERLLSGDWLIDLDEGKFINQNWFPIVDAVPNGGIDCDGWDLAATEKKKKRKKGGKHDPDFTANVKIRRVGGDWYILFAQKFRKTPGDTDTIFVNTSEQSKTKARAARAIYRVRWEEEGGASGKRDSAHLTKLLAGFDCKGVPASGAGDKFQRAKPFAVQAEAGNIKILRGPWNEEFLTELHNQPNADHDDYMDAAARAFDGTLEAPRKRARVGGKTVSVTVR
jgi:predicted phage terminase large subunit-like protein